MGIILFMVRHFSGFIIRLQRIFLVSASWHYYLFCKSNEIVLIAIKLIFKAFNYLEAFLFNNNLCHYLIHLMRLSTKEDLIENLIQLWKYPTKSFKEVLKEPFYPLIVVICNYGNFIGFKILLCNLNSMNFV